MSERLFEPFVDAIDGTACVSASATLADIEALCAPHRLRFPLILDAKATLRDHVEAATHAPASHRFGPFCDNILGMNWRLPSGKVVRVGERVAKTTTGYDWLRFLLHTGTRFGEPLDYVIRLRPDCGFTMVAEFRGEALSQVVHQLLHSGWMHWWDSVDYICRDGTKHVRVVVHTPREEAPIFEAELRRIASSTNTHVEVKHDAEAPRDGLPEATIKTTPDLVIKLAESFTGIGLCYCGVIHGNFDSTALTASLSYELHSRHITARDPSPEESSWLTTLEQALHER
ncbi:MAG: hypothetical protein K1X78_23920 [Verrucomicrobiaceae bacterium]|nr:hypothetical protein [Verrucomicrobiaceae bacterium]